MIDWVEKFCRVIDILFHTRVCLFHLFDRLFTCYWMCSIELVFELFTHSYFLPVCLFVLVPSHIFLTGWVENFVCNLYFVLLSFALLFDQLFNCYWLCSIEYVFELFAHSYILPLCLLVVLVPSRSSGNFCLVICVLLCARVPCCLINCLVLCYVLLYVFELFTRLYLLLRLRILVVSRVFSWLVGA